jgi:FlaG/FlaF family flagellin (archaellin)
VVGVVLLVAVTVILSAVVGVFALGVGTNTQTPRATVEFEQTTEGSTGNPDELQITHVGGDSVDNRKLYVTGSVPVKDAAGSLTAADDYSWAALGDGGDEVVAGDSILVEPPNGDPEIEDDSYRVVWRSQGQSATLGTWRGPDY